MQTFSNYPTPLSFENIFSQIVTGEIFSSWSLLPGMTQTTWMVSFWPHQVVVEANYKSQFYLPWYLRPWVLRSGDQNGIGPAVNVLGNSCDGEIRAEREIFNTVPIWHSWSRGRKKGKLSEKSLITVQCNLDYIAVKSLTRSMLSPQVKLHVESYSSLRIRPSCCHAMLRKCGLCQLLSVSMIFTNLVIWCK